MNIDKAIQLRIAKFTAISMIVVALIGALGSIGTALIGQTPSSSTGIDVNIENTGDGVNQIGVVEGNVRIDSSASTKSSQSDHSNGSE